MFYDMHMHVVEHPSYFATNFLSQNMTIIAPLNFMTITSTVYASGNKFLMHGLKLNL